MVSRQTAAADLLDLDIDLRLGTETWAQLWGMEEPNDDLFSALLI